MEEQKNDLGSFLHENYSKSNSDLAESIRNVKGITNTYDNPLIFQEKKSISKNYQKLKNTLKAFDADIFIYSNGKKFEG